LEENEGFRVREDLAALAGLVKKGQTAGENPSVSGITRRGNLILQAMKEGSF